MRSKRPVNCAEYTLKTPGLYGIQWSKIYVDKDTGKATRVLKSSNSEEQSRDFESMTKARQNFAKRYQKPFLSIPAWIITP